jgi:hypothetical protein
VAASSTERGPCFPLSGPRPLPTLLKASGTIREAINFFPITLEKRTRKEYLFAAAMIAAPAFADDVGVRVGPVGADATVGESHDRDRDRDRTVIKEREPVRSHHGNQEGRQHG